MALAGAAVSSSNTLCIKLSTLRLPRNQSRGTSTLSCCDCNGRCICVCGCAVFPVDLGGRNEDIFNEMLKGAEER